MKKLSSKLNAEEWVEDHCNEWDGRTPGYLEVEEAYMAGWAARGKADRELVSQMDIETEEDGGYLEMAARAIGQLDETSFIYQCGEA